MKINTNIEVPERAVRDFCEHWKITDLSLFGSVLRDDFGDGSDIDIIVSFDSQATWSLFDLCRMERELCEIFGRNVDLLTRHGVEKMRNWIRRKEILTTARPVYAGQRRHIA